MSGKRIVEETLCGHEGSFTAEGKIIDGMNRHPVGPWTGEYNKGGGKVYGWCPGGSYRVLTEGQYVLIEDVHDLLPDAWRVLNATAAFGHPGGSAALWRDLRAALRGDPIPSLDALSDHTEGTP